jgi:hypothetical protein
MALARLKAARTRGNRDLEKERYWRRQVADWHKSGLTAQEFCRQRDLNKNNLYSWQKELVKRDQEPAAVPPGRQSSTKAVTEKAKRQGAGCRNGGRRVDSATDQEQPENAFVRLRVVPDQVSQDKTKSVRNPTNGLVVTTPSGYQIWLTSSADVDLLGCAVRALEEMRC